MFDYKRLTVLPVDIQRDWRATLSPALPTEKGEFRLVAIRRTEPGSYEEQRIIVQVVDENGLPLPNVRVAFSFSTARPYTLDSNFLWSPPAPRRADIFPTQGGGQVEHIQGSAVKPGEPGGVSVYILEPEYSSDVVFGAGMLDDHTGLHLTFQLRRAGVVPLAERLNSIEARIKALEENIG